MAPNTNIMFIVADPFGNKVTLYEKTWLGHTSPKRAMDEHIPELGDVRESVLNPDRIRRSRHPEIGTDSCVFEKFIGPENILLRTPVLYDAAQEVSYEDGISKGHVMTAYYPDPPFASKNVGEVFWAKPAAAKGESK